MSSQESMKRPLKQQQNIEYSINPTCFQILLMLPVPCLCVGCGSCVTKTTRIQFDVTERVMVISIYPGLLSPCASQRTVEFGEVQSCVADRQGGGEDYVLYLITTKAKIELTGRKSYSQVTRHKGALESIMQQVGIGK